MYKLNNGDGRFIHPRFELATQMQGSQVQQLRIIPHTSSNNAFWIAPAALPALRLARVSTGDELAS